MPSWTVLVACAVLIVAIYYVYPRVIIPWLGKTRLGRSWTGDERWDGVAGLLIGAGVICIPLASYRAAVVLILGGLSVVFVARRLRLKR